MFIPFFAGMIIGKFWVGLGIWLGLAVLFFGYVEALVLCRHCPHYAEEGFLLKCHANSGLPKIPNFDPRPLSNWEQVIWIGYVAVLFLYYIPFFCHQPAVAAACPHHLGVAYGYLDLKFLAVVSRPQRKAWPQR